VREEVEMNVESQYLKIIRILVNQHLHGEVQYVSNITLGSSGSFVYLVDVVSLEGKLRCVAKFTPSEYSEDESVTNRVYGSRASSFSAAYNCLQQHHIPVPKLYAEYSPQPEIPFYYQLIEFLPGEDISNVLKSTPLEEQSGLQQFLGRHLAAIHQITRSYDGWVDLAESYSLSWHDAFFAALYQNLDSACNHSAIAAQRLEIMRAIAYYETQWSEPILFVLSHLDGLQGRIDRTSTSWRLMGVIDIEDHYFTDQRFVLSVFELVTERQSISILPDFWNVYQQQTPIDPTYWRLRPLFQIYVLLNWIKDKPLEQQKIVEYLSHKIATRCQLKEPCKLELD
jgi:Phosphotransferase enzyme family